LHLEFFIPCGCQRLLDDGGSAGLLAIYGEDSKWIWQAEQFTLDEALGPEYLFIMRSRGVWRERKRSHR